jgi:polyphosphate kinase 2 (PPK2 family)
MLEKVDLDKGLGKKEYKQLMPGLRNRLYALQKASWDAKIPVVIIFEGWDAAGKGTSIRTLTARLDPRGFKLYPIRAARTYEKKRPWLWRYWLKLPGRGEWAIFDRSWYGRVLVERVDGLTPEEEWRRAYRDIADFERTISDDGCLIIKFWLHISKQEQKKRYKKLIQDPLTAWQVTAEDWDHHSKYDDYVLAVEEMLERTITEWGPWTIVEATDRYHTHVKIFQTIISALEERLAAIPGALPPAVTVAPAAEMPIEIQESVQEAEIISEEDGEPQAEGEAAAPSPEPEPVKEKAKKKKKKKAAKKQDD